MVASIEGIMPTLKSSSRWWNKTVMHFFKLLIMNNFLIFPYIFAEFISGRDCQYLA